MEQSSDAFCVVSTELWAYEKENPGMQNGEEQAHIPSTFINETGRFLSLSDDMAEGSPKGHSAPAHACIHAVEVLPDNESNKEEEIRNNAGLESPEDLEDVLQTLEDDHFDAAPSWHAESLESFKFQDGTTLSSE